MGFRQRLGTAVKNINDLTTLGYIKGEEVRSEGIDPEKHSQSEKFALTIDGEELVVTSDFDGWEIKADDDS